MKLEGLWAGGLESSRVETWDKTQRGWRFEAIADHSTTPATYKIVFEAESARNPKVGIWVLVGLLITFALVVTIYNLSNLASHTNYWLLISGVAVRIGCEVKEL
jgi:hypothetical protein